MRLKLLCSLALFSLIINGCNSEVPSQIRYSMVQDLDPKFMSTQPNVNLRLNSSLNNGGIVLQISENTLREARFHRWAEPLDSQLKAIVSNILNNEKMSFKKRKLDVYVSRFQGSESGKVYVSASFTLLSEQGKSIYTVSRQDESYQSSAGYESLVSALRKSFDKICHEAIIELNSRN